MTKLGHPILPFTHLSSIKHTHTYSIRMVPESKWAVRALYCISFAQRGGRGQKVPQEEFFFYGSFCGSVDDHVVVCVVIVVGCYTIIITLAAVVVAGN